MFHPSRPGARTASARSVLPALVVLAGVTMIMVPSARSGDLGPIDTDRPSFTPSTQAVPVGHLQLESGFTFFTDRERGVRVRDHVYPELFLRYGLNDRVELRVGGNALSRRTVGGPAAGTIRGTDDLLLGVKLPLSGVGSDSALKVTLLPEVFVPTGSTAVGTGTYRPQLTLAYGKQWTPDLWGSASTGVVQLFDGAGETYTQLRQTVYLSTAVGEKQYLFGEVYGFFPLGTDDASVGTQTGMDAGLTHLLSDTWQADIRAGWGWSRAAPDLFVGTGIAHVF